METSVEPSDNVVTRLDRLARSTLHLCQIAEELARHLNGKVERSQKTDKDEFYSTFDLKDPELEMQLAGWQHYYNWDRPHGSHNGKKPMKKF